MKPKHFGILLLCAVFWTIGIAAFIYTTYKLEQVIPYRATFGVSEKQIGLSASMDELNLGIAPAGGMVTRHVFIENTQDGQREFTFVIEGDIGSYVEIHPQQFVLDPRETQTVDIIGRAPANGPYGNFSGTISLLIEKP